MQGQLVKRLIFHMKFQPTQIELSVTFNATETSNKFKFRSLQW